MGTKFFANAFDSAVAARALAAAVGALPAVALAAVPPPVVPIQVAKPSAAAAVPAAPAVDGSFPVTLSISGSLSGIAPAATKAAWVCSARVLSKPAADAEVAKIAALTGQAARDEFSSSLEYRAHYLGQQSSVDLALSGGATGASPAVTITVTRYDLVNQATNRLIDQPAVLVGCWLKLTNTAGLGGFVVQSSKPLAGAPSTAMLQLAAPPYVLLSASIPNG